MYNKSTLKIIINFLLAFLSEVFALKITVILNDKKAISISCSKVITQYLKTKNVDLFLPSDKAGYPLDECRMVDFSGVDIAVVVGGDGTMLGASRLLRRFGTAIVGVNMGRLGFLAEIEVSDILPALDRIVEENYFIEKRMLLYGQISREGNIIGECYALNDLVINKSAFARPVVLDLEIDGQTVGSYRGDGLIVASPTGSTAYAFSAGGPLLTPNLELLSVVPVCPHTFFTRPYILSRDSIVKIKYRSESGYASCLADGQSLGLLQQDDEVIVRIAEEKISLLHLKQPQFFERVKEKLLHGSL